MDALGDRPYVGQGAPHIVLGSGDRRRWLSSGDTAIWLMASRNLPISEASSCCTPSWMSRSIRRRSSSCASTMRAREAAISAAWCSIWRRRASSSSAWLTVRRRSAASRPRAPRSWRSWAFNGPPRFGPHSRSPSSSPPSMRGKRAVAGRSLVGGDACCGDDRNDAHRGRSRPAQAQGPAGGGDEQLEDLGSPGVLGRRPERVDQPGVAAHLAEDPAFGDALQPIADRQEQGGDRQHRGCHRCARHDVRGRGVGGQPGEPSSRTEDGHEADADCHLAHGAGGIAELGLDDGRRRTGGHRRPRHRPGQRHEEAVAELDDAEQADELHHGDDPQSCHQGQRQPAQLPSFVDARAEQRPGDQPGGDEGTEGEDEEHRLAGRPEEGERRHLQRRDRRQRPRLGGRVAGDAEHDARHHAGSDGDRADVAGQPRAQQRADGARSHHDGGDVEADAEGAEACRDRQGGRRRASPHPRVWTSPRRHPCPTRGRRRGGRVGGRRSPDQPRQPARARRTATARHPCCRRSRRRRRPGRRPCLRAPSRRRPTRGRRPPRIARQRTAWSPEHHHPSSSPPPPPRSTMLTTRR